jgi:superfamily II RNA helicase
LKVPKKAAELGVIGALKIKSDLHLRESFSIGGEIWLFDMTSAGMSNSAASVTATSGFTKLRPEYQSLVKSLHNLAIKLYSYRSEYKLNTVAEEAYLASFNFSLMEVISLWCSGGKFIDICRLTDVYEGTIIRVIRRLEELLRQLITASMMIGNMELKAKFEEGADRIRRGIIFTSSLYL